MRRYLIATLALHANTALAQSPDMDDGARPDPLNSKTSTSISTSQAPAKPSIGKPKVLVLAVTINGIDQSNDTQVLQLSNTDIAIPVSDLAEWRVTPPASVGLVIDGIPYAKLNELENLTWEINARTQTLVLKAKPAAFAAQKVTLGEELIPKVTASPPGAYLNYDVQVERAMSMDTASGLYQFSGFGKWGTASTSALFRSRTPTDHNVRLDSTWTIDIPEKRQSVWIGDAISDGGTWGRSVRFGGVRWGTNFGLTPSFSTLPLPTVRGETALPSTLDLFINNNYSSQSTLPAGPFDLANVPLVTGKGEIRMAVRDALGREQIIVQPYYTSRALLKPGLHDFSVEAGAVREDYGFESNSYGRSFISGTDRIGINSSFTGEVRGEFLSSQQTAGAGGTWLIGTDGTIGVQGAASRASEGNGWSTGVNMERQSSGISGNLIASYASRYFTQLGELSGRNTKATAAIAFGVPWQGGGLGASYAYQSTWQGERNPQATLSYSRSVGNNSYLAIAAARQFGVADNTSISVTLIHTLGTNHSVSAMSTRDGNETYNSLQLQRNTPAGPGYGYQINVDQSNERRINALGTYQNSYTRLNGAVSHTDGGDAYRVGANGAIAMMSGQVYPTRQIDDSFAVVKVGDYDGVSVLRDNQFVGRTNSAGYAFITGLRGYEKNRLSIEQGDLPFDAEIDRLDMSVTPAQRSGVAVTFPVRQMRPVTARLVRMDGTALAPGTQIFIQDQPRNSAVAYNGKIFISSTSKNVRLSARSTNIKCSASFEIPDAKGVIPDVGNVVCHESAP
jgi:outer membrane usher protein